MVSLLIILNPKRLLDRHIAQGLEDAGTGRTNGPYASADVAMDALKARAKKLVKKRRA